MGVPKKETPREAAGASLIVLCLLLGLRLRVMFVLVFEVVFEPLVLLCYHYIKSELLPNTGTKPSRQRAFAYEKNIERQRSGPRHMPH